MNKNLLLKKFIINFLIFFISSFTAYSSPIIEKVYPEDGEIISGENSTIYVILDNNAIKSDEIKNYTITLNGNDITFLSHKSKNRISLNPLQYLSFGKNQVKIAVDVNGQLIEKQWCFTYDKNVNITNIDFEPKDALIEGDELKVKMEGRPGGRAWFNLTDKIANIPMDETYSGSYEGTYKVKRGDLIKGVPITCYLDIPNENISRLESKELVSIQADFFRIRIISPKNAEQVEQNFKICGRTRPEATVRLTAKIELKKIAGINLGNIKTESGGIKAKADQNGYFEIEFGFPIKVKDISFNLTFFATDLNGNCSLPAMLTVYTKGSQDYSEPKKDK